MSFLESKISKFRLFHRIPMVNQPKPNQFMDSSSCMLLAYFLAMILCSFLAEAALLNSIKITSADLREMLSVQILYQMLYKN